MTKSLHSMVLLPLLIAAALLPTGTTASSRLPTVGDGSEVTVISSKGGGGGGGYYGKGCNDMYLYQKIEELRAGFSENAVGSYFESVPFYDAKTNETLGAYDDSATTFSTAPVLTGAGYSSYSFFPESEGDPSSQIALQFTFLGAVNSITGGNGLYGCGISGWETFTDEDEERLWITLTVCGETCRKRKDRNRNRL